MIRRLSEDHGIGASYLFANAPEVAIDKKEVPKHTQTENP